MSTPQREWKRVQRVLRNIPVEQIAPWLAAMEQNGLWCLIADELVFVSTHGGTGGETTWDDPVVYAQVYRYVQEHSDRHHPTHEKALEFVRSRLAAGGRRAEV
jgi:hypothetical protein